MKKLLPILFALTLMACTKPEGEIKMKPGETVADDEISLKFVDFSDSRCPTGAACIWDGETVVNLIFNVNDSDHTFTMGDHGVMDTVISNYQIKYNSLTPYPVSGENIKASKKRLTIEINKL